MVLTASYKEFILDINVEVQRQNVGVELNKVGLKLKQTYFKKKGFVAMLYSFCSSVSNTNYTLEILIFFSKLVSINLL